MYAVKHIYKSFGSLAVLKDASLEIAPNKTTVLIGPSGSGKTTLLRCINLLERPDSGTVELGGITCTFGGEKKYSRNAPEILAIRKKTGMVFQNFQLFPHMTVLGNIIEGPTVVLKKDRKECEAQAMELLRKVGLEDKRDCYPNQLSGGQQQRIAIARAMAMQPELLLFDEPTSALDPELEVEVLNIIRKLVEEKQTIVIVTHKMSFAREVADRMVFFDGGRIVESGSYDQLANSSNPRITQFLTMLA
jgi:cystine transport system ATP-binding protein